MALTIRNILDTDCKTISEAFQKQGWDKPISQYKNYVAYQARGERDIIIAEWDGVFAGYLTINWNPGYKPFQERKIPEIVDLNMLKKYQRLSIGTRLMDEAEKRIKKVSEYAGIGFGVTQDYGAAQVLYVNRNYIPDGNGLMKNGESLTYGDVVTIGHDLAFYLIKKL